MSSRELFIEYRARNGEDSQLILLFDEVDRYSEAPASQVAGRRYFSDLETARRNLPGIGIAAAGGMGVFVLREPFGRGFLSRAEQFLLASFQRAELTELARPFAEDGRPLDDQALDALLLASGGHPTLAALGLKELWDNSSGRRAADLIPGIFASLREQAQELLRDAQGLDALTLFQA